MTKVLEVTTAEDVTSHPHSIAITAPERVTFVKGTCPEETKWWFNVLSAFPKSKVIKQTSVKRLLCVAITNIFLSISQGRHKRNATFPGGQATTILQSQRKYLAWFYFFCVRREFVLCKFQPRFAFECRTVWLLNRKNDWNRTFWHAPMARQYWINPMATVKDQHSAVGLPVITSTHSSRIKSMAIISFQEVISNRQSLAHKQSVSAQCSKGAL